MNHLLVLGGGKGTRMQSPLPKVLTPVAGIPMLKRLTATLAGTVDAISIIVGYRGKEVIATMGNAYNYIWQHKQLGTGHAVLCAKESLQDQKIDNLVIVPGDHPLIGQDSITNLLHIHKATRAVVSLATIKVPNFKGECAPFENYGRIVRDAKGNIKKIVEFKDATNAEKRITELNVSYYAFNPKWLWENIEQLTDANNAKELYLTDLVELAKAQNKPVGSYVIKSYVEGMGVNTVEHIKVLEALIA